MTLALAVGEAVGAKIVTLRRLNPNPLPLPNFGENVVGKWRATQNHLGPAPLPPPAPFAFEFMADFHPFVLTGPARFRAPPPPELTSALYAAAYNEVKAKGALTGSTRTPEQTDIAWFWLDSFGVQLNRALRGLAAKHVPRIGDRARLYALANLAGADALITAWDSKRNYNFWRPVTAIQEGEFDGNPDTIGDPAWLPFTNNPPYPDHTSGANSITAGMMRAAALFFGNGQHEHRNYDRQSERHQEDADLRQLLGRNGTAGECSHLAWHPFPLRRRGSTESGRASG